MGWRIELLGWLRVIDGDRVITRFRSQRTGLLLAYLALYGRRSHPREELIERCWPECEPELGRNSLRVALSSLRQQLALPGMPAEAVLLADRTAVRLNPALCATDVEEFEAILAAANRAGSTGERADQLARALELYRGELLPGHFDAWVLPERGRLSEAFVAALSQMVAHLERAGDSQSALQWVRRAIAVDPLREELHLQLIRLLAATGQLATALREQRELERLLETELHAAPEAVRRDLLRQIERGQSYLPTSAPSSPPDANEPGPVAEPSFRAALVPAVTPEPPPTLLVWEIEGLASLRERTGERFEATQEAARVLLRTLFRQYGGRELFCAPGTDSEGDPVDGPSMAVGVFPLAAAALECARAGEAALAAYPWPPEVATVRVRMLMHTARQEDGRAAVAAAIRHATRLLPAAYGGQILLSERTARLLRSQLRPGLQLREIGQFHPRGAARPERLFLAHGSIGERSSGPPRASEPGSAGSLPSLLTRFFGRETEMAQLQDLLLGKGTQGRGDGGTGRQGEGGGDRVRRSPRPPIHPSPRRPVAPSPGDAHRARRERQDPARGGVGEAPQ
jgi:DNA-binding SARP family transcriptional activator